MEYTGLQPPNENVKVLLERVIEKQGFTECSVDIQTSGSKQDNYIGVLHKVRVQSSTKEDILNLIVKMVPEDEVMRKKTGTNSTFSNEILIYTEVLPIYCQIQEAANISNDKRYRFPKFYDSDITNGKECIILEDLNVEGFSNENKAEPLSYESIKLAFESLGKYHALSFAFREKNEDKYKFVVGKTQDVIAMQATNRPNFDFHFKLSMEKAASTVEDEEVKAKVMQAYEPSLALMNSAHKPWSDPKRVLIHGDSWVNNILFKMENGKPIESILIDYQLPKHSSPAFDILYLIFLSTNSETRTANFENLKNVYYDSLQNFMNDLGYDVSKYYTRDDLENDIVEFAPLALGLACMILPISSGEPPKSDNNADNKSKGLYDKRMGEVIKDLVTFKLI